MAEAALVVDASVAVKWFSAAGERELGIALGIRDAHARGEHTIIVPDIFYHEVVNALVHKRNMGTELVHSSIDFLFGLGMVTEPASRGLLSTAVNLARKGNMTEYDACYAAVAIKHSCPLVTANPMHQGRAMGCRVIPLGEWR